MNGAVELAQAEAQYTDLRSFATGVPLPCVATAYAKEVDAHAATGLPRHRLLLRAGVACGKWLTEHSGIRDRLLICCGAGNNGGDGLIAAAWMVQQGRQAQVLLAAQPATPDAIWAWQLAQDCGVQINLYAGALPVADAYVDALIGRGTKGALREPVATLAAAMQQSGKLIASIDMPTGWNSQPVSPLPILAMLAVDPAIGTVCNRQIVINAEQLRQSYLADLGATKALQTFAHTMWLGAIAQAE